MRHPRASKSWPGGAQKALKKPPRGLQTPPGALPERVPNTASFSKRSTGTFWSFWSSHARAPMWLPCHYSQCFVGFGRDRHRMRKRSAGARKSTRFDFPKRPRGLEKPALEGQPQQKIDQKCQHGHQGAPKAPQMRPGSARECPRLKNGSNNASHGFRISDPWAWLGPP